jgi:hypothetical protein
MTRESASAPRRQPHGTPSLTAGCTHRPAQLAGFSGYDPRRPALPGGINAGCRETGGRSCLHRQQNRPIFRDFTGATGLEPATSGGTGRVGHNDARRRTPLNGLICRHFSPRSRPPLRMVEPIVRSTFGPRVGHGIVSPWTTPRRGGEGRRSTACCAEKRFNSTSSLPLTPRQPVAIHGNRFGLFQRFRRSADLPVLAPILAAQGSVWNVDLEINQESALFLRTTAESN